MRLSVVLPLVAVLLLGACNRNTAGDATTDTTADATPPASKYINHTWFKITKHGNQRYKNFTGAAVFTGSCAELCGENHADMRMRVIALPVDQYTRWVEQQKQLIGESQKALAAQRDARHTRE